MTEPHIFLTYHSSDEKFARLIVDELAKRHIPVWFDKNEIRISDVVQKRLEEGLAGAKAVVILLGSVLGPWQDLEIRDGISESVYTDRPLFPILLKGSDPKTLPRFLRGYEYLDLREGQPYTATEMDSLAFAIKSKTHLGFNDHVGELHSFERDFLQVLLQRGNGRIPTVSDCTPTHTAGASFSRR